LFHQSLVRICGVGVAGDVESAFGAGEAQADRTVKSKRVEKSRLTMYEPKGKNFLFLLVKEERGNVGFALNVA